AGSDEWAAEFESSVFPHHIAVSELRKLEFANLMNARFDLQDYHALLLYFALQFWVEEHNDQVDACEGARPIGPFLVAAIDFDSLVDDVFWDVDFLSPARLVNLPHVKEAMRYADAVWSIANSLTVHPAELVLEECPRDCNWEDRIWHYVPGDPYPAACASKEHASDCGDDCYWSFRRD